MRQTPDQPDELEDQHQLVGVQAVKVIDDDKDRRFALCERVLQLTVAVCQRLFAKRLVHHLCDPR